MTVTVCCAPSRVNATVAVSPGFVACRAALTASGDVVGMLLIETSRSPARSLPSAAEPATTSATAGTDGSPSSRTAADSALISESAKSSAFFCCTCSSVLPGS